MKGIFLERLGRWRVPYFFGALCCLIIISLILMVASPEKKSVEQNQRILIRRPLNHNVPGQQSRIRREESNETKTRQGSVPSKKREFGKTIVKRNVDEQIKFGKRPYGPLLRYQQPNNSDLKWVAYFLEESLAVVLQSSENVMLECTVIELSTDKEQQDALGTFGSLMPLVHLPLQDIIRLMRLCGELPSNQLNYETSGNFKSLDKRGKENKRERPSIILPGTLWCGIRDRAKRFEHLGEKKDIDKCCRTHDHCPLKVLPFQERYGVTNIGVGAKSHCLCEEELYRCLKSAKHQAADMIGTFYFNVLRSECIQGPLRQIGGNVAPPYDRVHGSYECQFWDKSRNCRFWSKTRTSYNKYELKPFYLKY